MMPPIKPTEYPNREAVNEAVRAERYRGTEEAIFDLLSARSNRVGESRAT